MSEPADAPDPRRLDELAQVTKEYAKYSRTKFGLGTTAMGLWIVATGWLLTGASRTAGERMLIVTAVVWMACVARARRYYQRHGEVVELEDQETERLRGARLAVIYVYCVLGVLVWAKRAPGVSVSFFLAATSFIAVAMLVTRGTFDILETLFFLTLSISRLGAEDEFGRWVIRILIVFGAWMMVHGVLEHSRYRRLERRLAALRERA